MPVGAGPEAPVTMSAGSFDFREGPYNVEQRTVSGTELASAIASSIGSSSLMTECKQSILTQPDELEINRVRRAGKVNQSIDIKFHLDAVLPSECDARWLRVISLQPEIKLPGGGPWLNENGSGWDKVLFLGNQAGPAGLSTPNTFRKHKLYYRHGDQVRWRVRLQDEDTQTGHIIGTNIANYPTPPPQG